MNESMSHTSLAIKSLRSKEPRIVSHYGNDYLCREAESIMRDAIKYEQVINISNTLLLKYRGRLVALALKDHGNFKKGHWYKPTHHDRSGWWELYTLGVIYFEEFVGEWKYVREVNMNNIESGFLGINKYSLIKDGQKYGKKSKGKTNLGAQDALHRSNATPAGDLELVMNKQDALKRKKVNSLTENSVVVYIYYMGRISFEGLEGGFVKNTKPTRWGDKNSWKPDLSNEQREGRRKLRRRKGADVLYYSDAMPGDYVRVTYSLGVDQETNTSLGSKTVEGIIGFCKDAKEVDFYISIYDPETYEKIDFIPVYSLKKMKVKK